MRAIASCLLAALLLTSRATPVRAEDEATRLYKQGQLAEVLMHDPGTAVKLYLQAADKGGDGDVARDALLRAAELLERLGRNDEALEVLHRIMEKFEYSLSDAGKRQVHQALERLLPPGARERSPIGIAEGPHRDLEPATQDSPLYAKLQGLLAPLDDVAPERRSAVQRQIEQALTSVGKDVLPALLRVVAGDGIERAKFAAILYAKIGQADAYEGLGQAIREGDGFTRAAALSALDWIPPSDETSPAALRVLADLRSRPELAGMDAQLRRQEARHLSGAQLLERYERNGPHAGEWLRAAVEKREPRAIRLVLGRVEQGEPLPEGWLSILTRLAGSGRNWDGRQYIVRVGMPELETGLRRAIFRLMLERPVSEQDFDALRGVLHAMRETAGAAAMIEGLEAAWRRFLGPDDARSISLLARGLLSDDLPFPAAIAKDRETRSAYFHMLGVFADRGDGSTAGWLLPDPLPESPDWWRALQACLSDRTQEGARTLARLLYGRLQAAGAGALPPGADEGWIAFLRQDVARTLDSGTLAPFAHAAARGGGEAFVQLVLENADWTFANLSQALFSAFAEYTGPGRDDALETLLLLHPENAYRTRSLSGILSTEVARGNRRLLLQVASHPDSPLAPAAVNGLAELRAADDLLALMQAENGRETASPFPYRRALLLSAQVLHMREALPFLLREFELGLSDDAAAVMEAIRTYHQRLDTFLAWSRGEEGDVRDVLPMLEDEDPAIRRAAVLALGALGGQAALPRLLKLAKAEKDPTVRQAALDTIDRLATSADD